MRRGRLRAGTLSLLVVVAALCCLLFMSGCAANFGDDKGANQSLVEIGELSLEQGEALEDQGKMGEANIAYRKALWAFRYHERLTGEQPFLLDEALDGAERTTRQSR